MDITNVGLCEDCLNKLQKCVKPEPKQDLSALAHRITETMRDFDFYSFQDAGYSVEEVDKMNEELLKSEPEQIIYGLLDALNELIK